MALVSFEEIDQIAGPNRDATVRRDHLGRYLIPDPTTGKERSWMRATTLAKTLDDGEALVRWKCARTAIGVALKPSIQAGITAAQSDSKALGKLVDQAQEAAGANEQRELGTHLHRILELVDTGRMDPGGVPAPWGRDVSAYLAELKRQSLVVRPDLCEVIFLNHTLEVAGTCDRVYQDHEGRLVVADIKTGGRVYYLSFAMQFAIYATATHVYNPVTDELTPAPEMRQDHTLMVHAPAGSGTCHIEALSVGEGYEAVLMALEVRRTRAKDKAKHIQATTWQPPILELVPPPADNPVLALRAALVARVALLKNEHLDAARALARAWPDGIPTLSQSDSHTLDQLEVIRTVVERIEAAHGIPF